jgi:hypothetical protein
MATAQRNDGRVGFAGLFAFLVFATTAAAGAQADQGGVKIGGSVSITSSTGNVTTEATGEGDRVQECAGAITGRDVEIEGDVKIEHTGSPQGCTCVGECDGLAANPSDEDGAAR